MLERDTSAQTVAKIDQLQQRKRINIGKINLSPHGKNGKSASTGPLGIAIISGEKIENMTYELLEEIAEGASQVMRMKKEIQAAEVKIEKGKGIDRDGKRTIIVPDEEI